jgi:hypothetical protein
VRPVAEFTAGKARKCKVPFPRFVAVEYKTQLEHGTNYFVKVTRIHVYTETILDICKREQFRIDKATSINKV